LAAVSAASAFPRATIDTAALKNNLAVVRRYAPSSRVVAAVKANGYGHGLLVAARALADADAFGVARVAEALALRAGGIKHPIVVLEGAFSMEELAAAARDELQLAVHSFEQIAMLEQHTGGRRITVWMKIDTGMNRLGFRAEEVADAHARLTRCAALEKLLVMTHLASAESPTGPDTKLQLERFQALAAPFGLERSIANSAGLIAWPQSHAEWVRPGLMLYGMSPFTEKNAASLGLRPAMTLSTRVIAVRRVMKGEAIGYNGVWRAPRDSRIAVIAIGYGDGYPRTMRAGAPVLIEGREAPIAGRVSMDMTMIDVTDLPQARVGDDVTLFGEGLSAERVAAFADTLGYELVCRVTPRVQREIV
jgi:alanine racemase